MDSHISTLSHDHLLWLPQALHNMKDGTWEITYQNRRQSLALLLAAEAYFTAACRVGYVYIDAYTHQRDRNELIELTDVNSLRSGEVYMRIEDGYSLHG